MEFNGEWVEKRNNERISFRRIPDSDNYVMAYGWNSTSYETREVIPIYKSVNSSYVSVTKKYGIRLYFDEVTKDRFVENRKGLEFNRI